MFDCAAFMDTCLQRANFIEWLPFQKGQSVLTHSSIASAVKEMFYKKGVALHMLEEKQLEEFSAGNVKSIQDKGYEAGFDWIVLAGMPIDLNIVKGLYEKRAKNGRLVILLHNRYGISYLAGKPVCGSGYYAALEKEQGGKTSFTSFQGMRQLLQNASVKEYYCYYPDMDAAFASNIYSDDCLPKVGEGSGKSFSFTCDRMEIFDERAALDRTIADGMYPVFANDYLIVTGEKLPQTMVRYSNDRTQQYQIKTEICQTAQGKEVCKVPLRQEGTAHVQNMCRTYTLLCQQYDKEVFSIVPCRWQQDRIVFPFVTGISLAEHMKTALQNGDKELVFAWFRTFLEKLSQGRYMNFSNYDFIFSNIIIEGDKWQVIDYEWTTDTFVEPKELAFRAAYCFSLEHKEFPFEQICEELGFAQKQIQELIDKETAYQRKITGTQQSLGSLCAVHGGQVHTRQQLLRGLELSVGESRVQIYEDRGNGFCEEASYFVEQAQVCADKMELVLSAEKGVKALRLDPCDEPCIVQIKKLFCNGREVFLDKELVINGVKGKKSRDRYAEYVFATKDPNIIMPLEKLRGLDGMQKQETECVWKLELEIHKISMELAETLSKSIKRII